MRQVYGLIELKDTCVVYGSFDSMHRGHLGAVKRTVEEAAKAGLESVVLSFDEEKPAFTTEQEKAYFAEKSGVDVFISTKETAGMDQAHLIKDVLADKLGARMLVIGENHNDFDVISELAGENGIKVIAVTTEKENGEAITREAVETAFKDSDYEKLNILCGHPYIIMGEVVHGKALGRTVGMPTANIGVPDVKIKPVDGVYATLGHVAGGTYKSLTNIGQRPSVDNHDYVTIEAFLLDFKQNIYGKPFLLEVHKFIRGVQKFDNLEEVQQQVQKDLQRVRDFLEEIA